MSIDPNNLASTATLTFDDEFNSLNLWNGTSGTWSTNYWFDNAPNGGSLNDEQEWYINPSDAATSSVKPWTVSNGVLTLTAAPASPSIQPSINNYQYTSGMITTQHSFSQTYGYFEIRAELPAGQGFWPAFWLLPTDQSWPPEIDVFEMLGKDPTTIYTTVHSGPTNVATGTEVTVVNTSTGFHTYGVDWEPDYITWYFDGQQVFKTPTPADVNKPMYLLANLGLGGGWGGAVDGTTPFPGQYQIDYIRAYSAGASSTPPATPPPSSAPPPPPVSVATALPTFTLAPGSLDLRLTGTAAQTGIGNALDNVITSNDYGSTLVGLDGNDTLIAGHGPDVLTGGAGSDTFSFPYFPWRSGQITDFTPGTDKLDLSALFAAVGYSGSNPISDGYVSFVSDGAGNTNVYFDHAPNFAWPYLITTLDGVAPSSVSLADVLYSSAGAPSSSGFMGDANSHILWQSDSGQAAIWVLNGTSFSSGGAAGMNPGSVWHVMAAGDFNGDGKSDLLWQNDDGTVAVWLMNGTTFVSGGVAGANPGPSWHAVGTGDFNGDGKADILFQNTDGTPAIWMMNGTTLVSAGALPNPGTAWHVVGTGDFNGDGKSDILWQNVDGTPAIWLMNGTSFVSGAALPNPGSAWHLKAAGDFNGDGKPDLLWQNDDGTAAIWLMNGTTFVSGGIAGANPGPSWHAVGVGDFNGDGKADILWQNSDGTPAVWLMNGTSIVSGAALANPGPNWHVLAMGS